MSKPFSIQSPPPPAGIVYRINLDLILRRNWYVSKGNPVLVLLNNVYGFALHNLIPQNF